MRIIAIATLLSVGLIVATTLAAPVFANVAPEVSPVGTAAAASVCVIGYHYDCIIQIVCIRECGPPYAP